MATTGGFLGTEDLGSDTLSVVALEGADKGNFLGGKDFGGIGGSPGSIDNLLGGDGSNLIAGDGSVLIGGSQ